MRQIGRKFGISSLYVNSGHRCMHREVPTKYCSKNALTAKSPLRSGNFWVVIFHFIINYTSIESQIASIQFLDKIDVSYVVTGRGDKDPIHLPTRGGDDAMQVRA